MIAAIIQARMGSTRLPGKTLADVHGKPLLQRVIERCSAISGVKRVVVATTVLPEDDAVAACATHCGASVYRGSVHDVLDRYMGAAKDAGASVIVRITADEPLIDPAVCGLVLEEFLRHAPGIDFATNGVEPTWPDGMDVDVFSRKTLERAWREASLPSEREHVTPYIYNHPERFRLYHVKHNTDLSSLRWTVDYAEDLAFVRAVYDRLDHLSMFGLAEILAVLDVEPALRELNQGFIRNAGYLTSLAKDLQG